MIASDRYAEIEKCRVEFGRARRERAEPRTLHTSPRRAYELIRASLRAGELEPDALAENRLIDSLGISRNSVRRALSMLAEEGLLSRAPRRGTAVSHQIWQIPAGEVLPPEISDAQQWHRLQIEELAHCAVPATAGLRDRLEISDPDVLMTEQLFRLDGVPVFVRTGYVPMLMGAERYFAEVVAIDRRPLSYGPLFRRLFGAPLGTAETVVEAVPCEERTARLLGVEKGSPALLREVLVRDRSGHPREVSYTYYRGDRVALSSVAGPPGAAPADRTTAARRENVA
ncbi:GntR family transcriptional regulator [Frankia sp. AgKG'84/4]|uniref:GntR family transcriptional regulator n=1 Tax=Frankia sp. AgKG'84/4 TaxID=573490 RepID=UPI00200C87FA|nr:GntR family transcriptional regulator [Frankia sp. AgKG'84/4]MCL9798117.1 GntR family transcriptional regulator [Frankia sp. AgKG'84/4]